MGRPRTLAQTLASTLFSQQSHPFHSCALLRGSVLSPSALLCCVDLTSPFAQTASSAPPLLWLSCACLQSAERRHRLRLRIMHVCLLARLHPLTAVQHVT